jgi:hypothetical protein
MSDVRAWPLTSTSAAGSQLDPKSILRLALAGIGLAAGILALSLIIGSGPAAAQTPAGESAAGSSSRVTSVSENMLLVDVPPAAEIVIPHISAPVAVPAAENSPVAVFRATTSMTSAQENVCPVVDINSWRVPVEDPTLRVPAANTGSMSGGDKPMTGPTLSSDALSGDRVTYQGFTLCERASGDDLPSSPTYELASTPG